MTPTSITDSQKIEGALRWLEALGVEHNLHDAPEVLFKDETKRMLVGLRKLSEASYIKFIDDLVKVGVPRVPDLEKAVNRQAREMSQRSKRARLKDDNGLTREGGAGSIIVNQANIAAALEALDIPRENCRAYAERFSWEASARQFLDHLPLITG